MPEWFDPVMNTSLATGIVGFVLWGIQRTCKAFGPIVIDHAKAKVRKAEADANLSESLKETTIKQTDATIKQTMLMERQTMLATDQGVKLDGLTTTVDKHGRLLDEHGELIREIHSAVKGKHDPTN